MTSHQANLFGDTRQAAADAAGARFREVLRGLIGTHGGTGAISLVSCVVDGGNKVTVAGYVGPSRFCCVARDSAEAAAQDAYAQVFGDLR